MILPFRPAVELLDSIPAEAYAVGCLIVGLIFLSLGWIVYRFALLLLGLLVGGGIGWAVGHYFEFDPFYLAVPLGLILAVVTLMIEKVGTFFAGGVCGVIPVFLFVPYEEHGPILFAIAAAVFLVAGVLTLLLWKQLIIIVLSIIGAAATANGVLLMLERFNPDLTERITGDYPAGVGFAVAAMAAGGIFFQNHQKKKKSAAEEEEEG